ncbi:MAG: META domain-containing protein [Synergistaceae bacterium]|jgi:heat shock protein HslJ/membrane-bound inhibitor of C-type lysozyme|nr:META domain-containing protein [Synergistaceae bacterium]
MLRSCFKTLSLFLAAAALTLCPGASLAADSTDALYVFNDGRLVTLERVSSDSGERYEAPGDSGTSFASDEKYASLTVGGKEISKHVIIRDTGDDSFIITVDGENFPMENAISASGAKYEVSGDPDTFLWSKGASVTLSVRGAEYDDYNIWQPSGMIWISGRALPTEIDWKVKSFSDHDVIDGAPITLAFQSDGGMRGMASVNSYRSSWVATGGRLVILPPAATMMMGPRELMEQETAFFKALNDVMGFRIRHDGMTLITRDGTDIELSM